MGVSQNRVKACRHAVCVPGFRVRTPSPEVKLQGWPRELDGLQESQIGEGGVLHFADVVPGLESRLDRHGKHFASGF